jgi:hypothetical protein
MKAYKYLLYSTLLMIIGIFLFSFSKINSSSEKQRILIYYDRLIEYNQSENYKTHFSNFNNLRNSYDNIARNCNFSNDDIINRTIALNYTYDPDVVKIRNKWYSVKRSVDSAIINKNSL